MNDTSMQWVYSFGCRHQGDSSMRNSLAARGPISPRHESACRCCWAFITTEVCIITIMAAVIPRRARRSRMLWRGSGRTGASFADPENRCLCRCVRRARLDAGDDGYVLNLGLNDATVAGLARRSTDTRFAYDSYRFIQMYGDVVMEVDHGLFEDALEELKFAVCSTIPG